jgi:hypothetical protein
MGNIQKTLKLTTKEVALISVLSSVWIVSQIYLGPIVGRITTMHGMVNRTVGWFLMLLIAELTGKFGRVTIMAGISAAVTRVIRQSALLGMVVGSGYVVGGLVFDILFFIPFFKNLHRKTRYFYLLIIAILSGILTNFPYFLYKIYFLTLGGFILWLPIYSISFFRNVFLSVLGVFLGFPILPRINFWSLKSKKTVEKS